MAENEDNQTHTEVQFDQNVRTADDKVFFEGTAKVDERTQASIDRTLADQEAKGEDEELDDELGDTRTSTEEKSAKAASKKGRRK